MSLGLLSEMLLNRQLTSERRQTKVAIPEAERIALAEAQGVKHLKIRYTPHLFHNADKSEHWFLQSFRIRDIQ